MQTERYSLDLSRLVGKILQVLEAECICIRGKREEREGRSGGMRETGDCL